MSTQPESKQRSLVKGVVAGAIGGVIAVAAKTYFEKMYPPHRRDESKPQVLAEHLAGHTLDDARRTTAAESIHWGFGALTGAAYGAIAEYYPAATEKDGATFGLTLQTLTNKNLLPGIASSAPAADHSLREQTSQAASHVLYGMVTETVRLFLRRIMH